jgi:hypothetical protein
MPPRRLLVRQVLALDEQVAELEAAIDRAFAGLGYTAGRASSSGPGPASTRWTA